MKRYWRRGLPLALLVIVVGGLWAGRFFQARPAAAADGEEGQPLALEGRTQPAPGHVATIAPQTLQPVAVVRVALGDHVKKNQVLIQHDDDEDRATIRMKEAALEEARAKLAEFRAELHQTKKDQAVADLDKARIAVEAARKRLLGMEPAFRKGALAVKTYRDAQTAYARAQENERIARDKLRSLAGEPVLWKVDELEAQVREAQADLDNARANCDNNTLRARISGVVVRLDVNPGAVGRPGLAVWGEIVDLKVLDVRCEVKPTSVSRFRVGQEAEVREEGGGHGAVRGRVVVVGSAADPRTGLIPVLVRIPNPEERLPCYVPVRVIFLSRQAETTASGSAR